MPGLGVGPAERSMRQHDMTFERESVLSADHESGSYRSSTKRDGRPGSALVEVVVRRVAFTEYRV